MGKTNDDAKELLLEVMRVREITLLAQRVCRAEDATSQEKITMVMFLVCEVADFLLRMPEKAEDYESNWKAAAEGIEKVHNILGSELNSAGFMVRGGEVEAMLDWAKAGCPPRHNWNLAKELLQEEEGS